jgi:8-oxo-dGTP pyrophosphatase MutT (NUDIX family)
VDSAQALAPLQGDADILAGLASHLPLGLRRRGPTCFGCPRLRLKNTMATADTTILCQYGALPFSITEDGEIRVLLVTTRGRRDWIIPKGWPIRNLTAAATAAREAYEEAGLVGMVVGDEPLGLYRYEKQRNSQRPTIFEVTVFLFAVERQLRKWPERSQRETRWCAPDEASRLVGPAGLADILRTATSQIPIGHEFASISAA